MSKPQEWQFVKPKKFKIFCPKTSLNLGQHTESDDVSLTTTNFGANIIIKCNACGEEEVI